MPENRQYAGPHDAAELLIAGDRYALVVRNDLTDEQAHSLGYTFDGDEAVETGRALAVRTVTVSDALGEKLDAAAFEDPETRELVKSWPKIGGTPAEQTVDVPEENPPTMNVKLDDGTEITASEADRRAYAAAAVDEVLEEAAIDAADSGASGDRDALARERIGQIDTRLERIDAVINGDDDLGDADEQDLIDEHDRLTAERGEIEKALAGGGQ